jgi:hypothetical protein
MAEQPIRRSDRISLPLPIEVSGMDGMGMSFVEHTTTVVVSRHGARILSQHMLVPEQVISIRCIATGQETDVRVVGQLTEGPEGHYYGVAFLDPDANIWGVEFPPLSESESAVVRVVLQCVACHRNELTYLDGPDAEFFEVKRRLRRYCKRCTEMTIWRPSLLRVSEMGTPPPELVSSPGTPAPRVRDRNERKHPRLSTKMKACVRHSQYGEEIVETLNVSRSGMSFTSSKRYEQGWLVEVALPYLRGGPNIFVPARIVRTQALPGEGMTLYAAEYVPVHKGWPGS